MLWFEQVINFDMPQSAVRYVHRIGRTGRAYDMGESVSLVSFHYSLVFVLDNKELTFDFLHDFLISVHYCGKYIFTGQACL